MRWSRRALNAALVFGFAAVLQAQSNDQFSDNSSDLLSRFDENQDGQVTEAEYIAYMRLGFIARDLDNNGVLDGEEIPAGVKPIDIQSHEEKLSRQFKLQDINADGFLSVAELLAPPRG